MSQSGKTPLDEYERAVADAERVLAKMETSLKLSPELYSSSQRDQQANCSSSGRISLTFTWVARDPQR
jgi:hypothetical protein